MLDPREAVRDETVTACRRRYVEPNDRSRLRHPPLVVEWARPVAQLQRSPAAATEVDAPGDVFAGRIAHRAKRNGELGRPARFSQLRSGTPGRIPCGIDRPTVVPDLSVALSAQGIGHEEEAGAVVVVRIEQYDDGVVFEQVGVAARELGGRRLGVVEAEGDVKRGRIIHHERLREDHRRLADARLELDEVLG